MVSGSDKTQLGAVDSQVDGGFSIRDRVGPADTRKHLQGNVATLGAARVVRRRDL